MSDIQKAFWIGIVLSIWCKFIIDIIDPWWFEIVVFVVTGWPVFIYIENLQRRSDERTV